MWHPNPEEMARLLDEPPTATESAHLDDCAECAAELQAMRAERDALATLPRILPVPTSWDVMRHRLERAGLLSGDARRLAWVPGVAAALALFLAGGATGVAFAGGWNASRDVAVASDPVTTTPAEPLRGAIDLAEIEPATRDDAALDARPEETSSQPPMKLAAIDESARRGTRPTRAANDDELPSLYGTPVSMPNWDTIAARASRARTPAEAARYMRDTEGAYLAAMTRLAELTAVQSSDPAVRLATLDGIVVQTGAALERTPADPVINGYHLAARAQRDALLRTVSSSPEQDPWY